MICSLFFQELEEEVGIELNCANNAKTQISGVFFQTGLFLKGLVEIPD